jgi:hypothetical protein
MSSSVSGSSVSSRLRLSSGLMMEKNGFSVVAATRVTQRFSTAGSRASCWVLEKRCTSSTNRTVCAPVSPSVRLASSTTCRTSFTPAVTADSSRKRRELVFAMSIASVVLPVPGGPHRITLSGAAPSTSRRKGAEGPSRCA